MHVVCPVCGEEVINAVGRQKYHGRCKQILKKYKRMELPHDKCMQLAQLQMSAYAAERLKKTLVCAEEGCLAFRRTGDSSGTCMFPHCIREKWNF